MNWTYTPYFSNNDYIFDEKYVLFYNNNIDILKPWTSFVF